MNWLVKLPSNRKSLVPNNKRRAAIRRDEPLVVQVGATGFELLMFPLIADQSGIRRGGPPDRNRFGPDGLLAAARINAP